AEIVDQQGMAARRIEPLRQAVGHDGDQPVGILNANALDAGFAMDAEAELALVRSQSLLVRTAGDRTGGERNAQRDDIRGGGPGGSGDLVERLAGLRQMTRDLVNEQRAG